MSGNQQVIIFCNPRSGRFSKRKIREIYDVFKADFSDCKLISEIPELKNIQHSHIVAVGGDGTFHVAVNHADLKTNTFSILALGSGNDFVSAFGRSDARTLCEKIKKGNEVSADLINAGGIYAHTVCGVGFEALVSQKANESKNPIPALKFIIPVARYMFFFKPLEVRVKAGDLDYSGRAFMVSMGNGKRAGGGFKLFPKAELNDGLLDLMLITTPTFWQKLLYVWLVNFGWHLHLKVVKYIQSSEVEISLPGRVPFNADGDVYETGSLHISVERGVLRVIQ